MLRNFRTNPNEFWKDFLPLESIHRVQSFKDAPWQRNEIFLRCKSCSIPFSLAHLQDIISWNIEFYYMQEASATHLLSFIHIRRKRGWNINSCTFFFFLFVLHFLVFAVCTSHLTRVRVGNASRGWWWCTELRVHIHKHEMLKAFHRTREREGALSWQAEWGEDKLSTIKKKWRKKSFSHCRHGKVIFHNIEQLLNNKKKPTKKKNL